MNQVQENFNKSYFKEQFLYAVQQVEKDEIRRRTEVQMSRIMTIRKKGRFVNFWNYCTEYCYTTDVHGLSYLSEKRSFCEKMFWSTVVLISVVACIIFIVMVILEHKKAKITVTLNTDIPVHTMRFPAVTICPEISTDIVSPKYNKILMEYKYILCSKESKNMENGSDFFNDADFFKFIKEFKKPVREIFFFCEFFGHEQNCSDIFVPTLTELGICYSFNMLSKNEIFEDGVYNSLDFYKSKSTKHWTGTYSEISRLDSYPKSAYKYGATNDLRVILKSSKDSSDPKCRFLLDNYIVHLHNPDAIPRPTNNFFIVPPNKFVAASIETRADLTDRRALKLPYFERQCYSPGEMKLKYFKRYHRQHCLFECLTNVTFELCKCVQFFMPRFNNTPICGAKKLFCVEQAEDIMIQREIQQRKKSEISYCGCRPSCEEMRYKTEETVKTKWNWQAYYGDQWDNSSIEMTRQKLNFSNDELAMFSIYIKYPVFTCVKRREWWGIPNLLSAIGGYLSFFNGMSIVSVLELVYFLTIRIICNRLYHGDWWGQI